MNVRRGFKRLFLVLAICYYAIGGLLVYSDWTTHTSAQRFELSRCLDAVASKRSYSDVNGNPILVGSDPVSKEGCSKAYPPVNEWPETLALLFFPALLYGVWKVLAWIGWGFRDG
jgi:hypothetical protein